MASFCAGAIEAELLAADHAQRNKDPPEQLMKTIPSRGVDSVDCINEHYYRQTSNFLFELKLFKFMRH